MTELWAEVQNESSSNSIYVIRLVTISLVKIRDFRIN